MLWGKQLTVAHENTNSIAHISLHNGLDERLYSDSKFTPLNICGGNIDGQVKRVYADRQH